MSEDTSKSDRWTVSISGPGFSISLAISRPEDMEIIVVALDRIRDHLGKKNIEASR